MFRGDQEQVHEMGACTERKFERGEGGVGRSTGPVQGTGAAARRPAFWRPATEGAEALSVQRKGELVRNTGVSWGQVPALVRAPLGSG